MHVLSWHSQHLEQRAIKPGGVVAELHSVKSEKTLSS